MQTERDDVVQASDGDTRVIRDKDRRVSKSSTAAPALLIGSLVMIAGTFLDWIDGREQSITDPNGFQIPDGRVVLGIGAALLVMGILMAKNRRVGTWFDADLLGVALSTFALVTVVSLWAYLASDERSPDIGLYVAAAGSAVAMIGTLAALLRSGSDRATVDDEGRGDVGRGTRS